jgi:subtilisin family serine protease
LSPDQIADHPHARFLLGGYRPYTLCVLMVAGTGLAGAENLASIYGMTVEAAVPAVLMEQELYRMRIPAGSHAHRVAATISLDPAVVAAGPNYVYDSSQSTSSGNVQFSLDRMNVAEAHRIATGNNVIVAVIDTGIDASHPELQGVIVESFDAIDAGPDAPLGHGTAMAGVIAASHQLRGIAPSARILSARAFGASKDGGPQATTFAIIRSMDWAVQRGARIFNLSFAGPQDRMLIRALDALGDSGTIMVAAAGNAGPEALPAWPAAHRNVIAVTATDQHDGLYAFANRGSYVFIAAPGVDILTTAPGGRYKLISGTSIAAAHVTGVIALMLERNPELDAAMVAQLLLQSSLDLGPKGMDAQFGVGLVDAFSAVRSGDLLADVGGGLTASE